MAQCPLGLVVGQRQVRMGQHAKDRLPVIEKFHRQGVSFLVGGAPRPFTRRAELIEWVLEKGSEVLSRPFPSLIDRLHQRLKKGSGLLAKLAALQVQTFF